MKTAKIPVYENIAVYETNALSVYQVDYTLRCYDTGSRTLRPLNHEDTDKCACIIVIVNTFRWICQATTSY